MKFQSVASVAVWATAVYLAVSTETASAGVGMWYYRPYEY